jgi:hypothetical protein
MTSTPQFHKWILSIARVTYSILLILGSIYSFGYAPPSYRFTIAEYCRLVVPFIHVILIWITIFALPFRKVFLLINLIFHITTMALLIWMLQSNDINLFIFLFIISWCVLGAWTHHTYRQLNKNKI